MEITLLQELQEVMKKRNIKLRALSKKIDIPVDRMYKWYQEGSTPKLEDAIKLRAWIDNKIDEKNSNLLQEEEGVFIPKRILILLESQQRTLESQQSTIHNQHSTIHDQHGTIDRMIKQPISAKKTA